jgi:hypothetical protein
VSKKQTVGSIVKAGRRPDGKRVEVQGQIMWGFETFIFKDASTCPKGFVCAMWVEIDPKCAVKGGSEVGLQCGTLLKRSARQLRDGDMFTALYGVNNLIVRGIVSTVRRDVPYSPSLPKHTRVGFGNLSAFPAEIRVEEIEVERSR